MGIIFQNRFGVGVGRLLLRVELCLFLKNRIIMKATFLVYLEWSQRNRAAIRKEGGVFSLSRGTCRIQQGERSYYYK